MKVLKQFKAENAIDARDQNTMEVMRNVANSYQKFLEFTTECSEGKENKVACLDSQFWWGKPEKQEIWLKEENTNQKSPGQEKSQKSSPSYNPNTNRSQEKSCNDFGGQR